MERVSFVNKISSVMKATADDESPIPGYLYPEISKITLESDGACESLLEFLVDRLDRNSCHVKVKVLKLMKYVVENGNPNFAMGLRKKSRGLKEATSYGGPPDPLHGNIPYVLVRKAAKELSELVFDTEAGKNSQTSPQKPVMKSKGGMGGGYRGQGMEGFGNSPKQQEKTLGNAILTGLNKLAEKVIDSPTSEGSMKPALKTSSGDYTPVQVHPTVTSHTPQITSTAVKTRTAPRQHIPGRAGGGWADDLDPEVKLSSSSRSDGSQGHTERYESTSSTEDWSNEESLVSEVTDKQDKFLLTRSEISFFLKKCPSVNCEKTVELLNRNLEGTMNHITMKCLQLLEGLLRCDLVNLEFIAVTCQTNLVSVYHTNTSQISAKAKKIIRILEKLTSHGNILPLSTVSSSSENRSGEQAVCVLVNTDTLTSRAQSSDISTGCEMDTVDKDISDELLDITDNDPDLSDQACGYVPAFFDSSGEAGSLINTTETELQDLQQTRGEATPDDILSIQNADVLNIEYSR